MVRKTSPSPALCFRFYLMLQRNCIPRITVLVFFRMRCNSRMRGNSDSLIKMKRWTTFTFTAHVLPAYSENALLITAISCTEIEIWCNLVSRRDRVTSKTWFVDLEAHITEKNSEALISNYVSTNWSACPNSETCQSWCSLSRKAFLHAWLWRSSSVSWMDIDEQAK